MDTLVPIAAICFDLDGTLMDSERYTDRAVAELLAHHSINTPSIDYFAFHGISWKRLDVLLKKRFPILAEADILGFLEKRFYQLSAEEPPPLLPGARTAFLRASDHCPVAIVTGSGAADVEAFLDRADLKGACSFYLSYEMYNPSKPDPACYCLAAERFGVVPDQCLAFEDSHPGLTAARAAGMRTVAVTGASLPPAPGLADRIINDYANLPADFFAI